MKILVTGGVGYLGSVLLRRLVRGEGIEGASGIRVLDNLSRGSLGGLVDLPKGIPVEFIEGDILDPVAVRQALGDVNCVVHLASVVRTPFSFDHPETTQAVNHWGTSRLVEFCLEREVERFIFASSTSVYGSGRFHDETSLLHPVGPYSSSKARAEHVVSQAGEGNLPATILRFGTIYGYSPCLRLEAVPNRFAYLASIRKPLTVYGGGDQVRPLVHIRDAVAAILLALNDPPSFERRVFNVASENLTVLEMARSALEVFPGSRLVHTARDVMTHISLSVSAERIEAMGWSPTESLGKGLREIWDRLGPFAEAPAAASGLALED